MSITANVGVQCCIRDGDGDPVAGATVTMRLSGFDKDGACFVVPEDLSEITDAQGECTILVWPNSAGEIGTSYIVTASKSGVSLLSGTAFVPDVENLQLTDLLNESSAEEFVVERRNLLLFDGFDYEAVFDLSQRSGNAVALTAYNLVMLVYDTAGGVLQYDSSVDSGFELAGLGSELTLSITSARIATITSGWYYTIAADDGTNTYPVTYGTLYKQ